MYYSNVTPKKVQVLEAQSMLKQGSSEKKKTEENVFSTK